MFNFLLALQRLLVGRNFGVDAFDHCRRVFRTANVRKADHLDTNRPHIGLDLFQCVFKQLSFPAVNEFIGAHPTCETIKGVSNFLPQVGVGDVVHAFTVGLENGCNFGRINLVRDPDVVADGGAIAHLEVESVIIRFHLLEGRKDINLCIPAGPVAADSDDFTNAFIVAQLIHLDTHVAGLNSIATNKADGRECDN